MRIRRTAIAKASAAASLDVPLDALRDDVAEQVAALFAIALEEGAFVTYVKPHGALYTRAIADADVAQAIVDASFDYGPAMLAWPGRRCSSVRAQDGMEAFAEGFADRGYANGRLVPRDRPGALLAAPEAAAQAVRLAAAGEVQFDLRAR